MRRTLAYLVRVSACVEGFDKLLAYSCNRRYGLTPRTRTGSEAKAKLTVCVELLDWPCGFFIMIMQKLQAVVKALLVYVWCVSPCLKPRPGISSGHVCSSVWHCQTVPPPVEFQIMRTIARATLAPPTFTDRSRRRRGFSAHGKLTAWWLSIN